MRHLWRTLMQFYLIFFPLVFVRYFYFRCIMLLQNSIFKRRRHTLWIPGKARETKAWQKLETPLKVTKTFISIVLIALFSDFSFFRRSVFFLSLSLSLPFYNSSFGLCSPRFFLSLLYSSFIVYF